MRESRRIMRFSLLSHLFGVRGTREDKCCSSRNRDKLVCHCPESQDLFSSQDYPSLVKVLALSIAAAATIKVFQIFDIPRKRGYSRASAASSIV
jgi:hypothetical protein